MTRILNRSVRHVVDERNLETIAWGSTSLIVSAGGQSLLKSSHQRFAAIWNNHERASF